MKKAKKRIRLKIYCFLVSVCILSTFLYVSSNKILKNLAIKSFDSLISSASYYSIEKLMEDGYNYKSLIDISTDKNGEINMVTTNSFQINSIASKIATNTYNYLVEYANYGIDVPIGAFTGVNLLSGFGKKIKMKLIFVSSVKCEILSSFTDAGINQTRHTLTICVTSTISLVTKSANNVVTDKISILVYDNLIIGKVPSVYLNSHVIGNADKN